jgi:UDP-MurNAc hydroxylase
MDIRFVNHSCFVVEEGNARLIFDPWIEGKVFNDGWDLIVKTPFAYDDFARITHICFSHEHPDHFYPPNLTKIPADIRRKISVMFQETQDKRLVRFCKKGGFKEVVELKKGEWFKVNQCLSVLCEPFTEGDSWIAVKSSDAIILNTNDCGLRSVRDARAIRDKVGRPDILMTQFSYAFWAGNRQDRELRRRVADQHLKYVKLQCDVFEPKVVVPFASYIWFCHEENFYLNDEINRPSKVFNYLRTHTSAEPVILFPGDLYTFGTNHDSQTSIKMYEMAMDAILQDPQLVRTRSVNEVELSDAVSGFLTKLTTEFGIYTKLLMPTHIFVSDYGKAFVMSLRDGFVESSAEREQCDVDLSSESLLYCVKLPWGIDTLGVNGRYQRPRGGNYARFYRFFRFY